MTDKPTDTPVATLDAELEARIICAYYKAAGSKIRKDWDELARLIKQRSPSQVRRMEKELGIG